MVRAVEHSPTLEQGYSQLLGMVSSAGGKNSSGVVSFSEEAV